MKALCMTNGKFEGLITSSKMYEKFKNGEADWKPHVKANMESITIPYDVFLRLVKMDKENKECQTQCLFYYWFYLYFFYFKNSRTYQVRKKIIDAIYFYRIDCHNKDGMSDVNFNDIESYESSLFRFWDWGYKHILPPEKYEIIKPFIIK